MKTRLTIKALEQLFTQARSFQAFENKDVPDSMIEELYELMKWAPTSMNCQPARFIVVKSREAKEKLRPTLAPPNQPKMLNAPATIIIATDTQFHQNLAEQFPAYPNAMETYANDKDYRLTTAFRNATLQGAYLIIAARSLGLDCGPMSGFNNQQVDNLFFPDGRFTSNFIVNIGYGNPDKNHPRGPRLPYEQVVNII